MYFGIRGNYLYFNKLNICKFKNLYEATTASLLEESKSEIYLKLPTIRDTKLASQQFVIRMDTTLSDTLNSNEANKKITTTMKCNQCDYTTTGASNLRAHLKSHLGEKSHKFNLCDYSSVHASNLRVHLKSHSGEKSFKYN